MPGHPLYDRTISKIFFLQKVIAEILKEEKFGRNQIND
jgi:hypothetical protein